MAMATDDVPQREVPAVESGAPFSSELLLGDSSGRLNNLPSSPGVADAAEFAGDELVSLDHYPMMVLRVR